MAYTWKSVVRPHITSSSMVEREKLSSFKLKRVEEDPSIKGTLRIAQQIIGVVGGIGGSYLEVREFGTKEVLLICI